MTETVANSHGQKGLILTPESVAAAHRLQSEEEAYAGLPLRVYVEGKGCDGFYYGVTFDDASDADLHFPQGGLDVIIDPDSYVFCKGSEIEWVDDERGRGFLVNNPNQRKFRGKFYKRKVWQERLANKKSGTEKVDHGA